MSEKASLNQKIAELDHKTEWFYSDDFKLEYATERYKEVLKLAKEVEKELTELKNKFTVCFTPYQRFKEFFNV